MLKCPGRILVYLANLGDICRNLGDIFPKLYYIGIRVCTVFVRKPD